MFEAVAAGIGGADFYRKALVDLDDATLRGPDMVAVFTELAALRGMIDANAPGRDWNLASAMVINGEAAMQIMGDWAKGEFTNAGKLPGTDYACIPVPKAKGDAFVYLVNSLSLFTQDRPRPDQGAGGSGQRRSWTRTCRLPSTRPRGRSRRATMSAMAALDACAQATSAAMCRERCGRHGCADICRNPRRQCCCGGGGDGRDHRLLQFGHDRRRWRRSACRRHHGGEVTGPLHPGHPGVEHLTQRTLP